MAQVPTVPDYTPTTPEDTLLNGQVVGTDGDSDPLTYSLGAQATNGVATVNPDGTWTYMPAANYNGTDVFTVIVDDGVDGPATSTVTVTVTAVADAPVNTVPGAQSTAEDTPLAFNGAKLITVNDVDGNLATTRVTVTNGTLNVSLAGGATISAGANSSATLTLSGTQVQINAALATLVYTPTLNYSGAAVLTVLSTDATGTPLTDSDTVAITVTAVNDAPVNTVPGAQSTAEDTVLVFNGAKLITVNDVDGNLATTRVTVTNGVLNVSLAGGATISAGANNSATLTLSGTQVQINAALATLTYTPTANYVGGAVLTVLSTDASAATDSDTVAITVTAVNDVPVAVADSIIVAEGGTATTLVGGATSLLANDTDVEGSTLTAVKVTDPVNGTLTLNANGTFSYVHNGSETTSDSFTYRANDGTANSNIVTVNITITAVNDPPVVPNYTETVVQDNTLTGAVVATDAEGAALTYTEGVAPAHGVVVVDTDGSYEYVPEAGYVGPDSFTVVASDGTATATSTVNVTVTATNVAPSFPNSYDFEVDESGVHHGGVQALDPNDDDELVYTVSTEPLHGTVAMNPDGTYMYEPTAGYFGPDSFEVTVSDGSLTASTIVAITVLEVNDPPVIPNYTPTVAEDAVLNGKVTATDADDTFLVYTKETEPTHGTLYVNNSGDYVYTPKAGYNGSDTFQIKVTDPKGGSAVSTVTVTVTAVNDPPEARDTFVEGAQDTPLVIPVATLLASTSDGDGNTLTVASVQDPVNGTVALGGGNVTFTPTADFNGGASFTYTVSDGNGGTATARVAVTIAPAPAPDLATVVAKVDAGGELTMEEAWVLQEAAEAKYKAAVLARNTATGSKEPPADAPYCRNGAEVLQRLTGLVAIIAGLQREVDEANKIVTAAQVVKIKEVLAKLDL